MNRGAIRVEVMLDELELFCDPVIEKVFFHLIQSTFENGDKATVIRISSRPDADHLVIVYEDDGVGIPEERKKSIFIRDVAKFHGFGMFFINDILEIAAMSIEEIGVPGKGVRFEILVPKGSYRFGKT